MAGSGSGKQPGVVRTRQGRGLARRPATEPRTRTDRRRARHRPRPRPRRDPAEHREERIMNAALEVVILPVSDPDKSLDFYRNKLGFALDVDYIPTEDFRVVQLTPLGS